MLLALGITWVALSGAKVWLLVYGPLVTGLGAVRQVRERLVRWRRATRPGWSPSPSR
jgi:hypothetical protein